MTNYFSLIRHSYHPSQTNRKLYSQIPQRVGAWRVLIRLFAKPDVFFKLSDRRLLYCATKNQRDAARKYIGIGSMDACYTGRVRLFCLCMAVRYLADSCRSVALMRNRGSNRLLGLFITHYYLWLCRLLRLEPNVEIVIPSNFGVLISPLLYAACDLDINTTYYPHARLSRYYKFFLHSHIYLNADDIGTSLAVSLGADKALAAKAIHTPLSADCEEVDKKDLLVALSLVDTLDKKNLLVAELEKRKISFDLRAHPREKRRGFRQYRRGGDGISALAQQYRVYVSSFSSSYFEFMELGLPTYLVNLTDVESPPYDLMPEPVDIEIFVEQLCKKLTESK